VEIRFYLTEEATGSGEPLVSWSATVAVWFVTVQPKTPQTAREENSDLMKTKLTQDTDGLSIVIFW